MGCGSRKKPYVRATLITRSRPASPQYVGFFMRFEGVLRFVIAWLMYHLIIVESIVNGLDS